MLDVAGELAGGRGGQDVIETSLQSAPLGGDGRRGEASDIVSEGKSLLQPKSQARRQDFLARLVGIGDVSGEMGKAGLVRVGVSLLRRIAVGAPDLGPVPSIRVWATTAPRVGAA